MSGENEQSLIASRNFPVLQNDRIFKAINGELPDKLPVWIMRQAGRYLPEFQALRKEHSFMEICKTPSLACEVTLMPIRRYQLDAAIIFSDILVIPEALGMELKFDVGPIFSQPLKLDGISKLNVEGAINRLCYVGQAISLTRHKLNGKVPLFGFSGAPWTLMGFMIEGGSSRTLSKARKWLYAHPDESHELLSLLTDVIIDYLAMQVSAGAQILQVFESSAEYLSKSFFETYCLPYLKKIREGVQSKLEKLSLPVVPMVLFAKGAGYALKEQAKLGYDVLSVDWTVEPSVAREAIKDNPKITLQGNLDPCALYAPQDKLREYTNNMIKGFGTRNYIVNLGHGIYPDMTTENVEVFIKAVHNYTV